MEDGIMQLMTHYLVTFEFIELWAAWDMTQIVQDPTRGNNYLDLIMTTCVNQFNNVTVYSSVHNSDHCLVSCEWLENFKPTQAFLWKRNFLKADYQTISAALLSLDCYIIFARYKTVNDFWSALYGILTQVINAFVPLSRRYYCKRNHLPSYIDVTILRKKKTWRHWRNSPNNINKKLYNSATRNCSNLLHQHRAAEEAELLRSSSHTFFNLVSRRLHPTNNGITLCEADKVLTDA
jgi:hypothetical protein